MPSRCHVALPLALLASMVLCSARAQAEKRTGVTIGSPIHVSSLEPAQDGFIFQRMQVGETLVEVDRQGRLLPGLATEWQSSANGLTWRFKLRSGVRFHDGSSVDAKAGAASLERARGRPGPLRNAPVEKVEAAGDWVVVSMKEPFSALPAVLSNYSTLILAPASFDATGTVTSFIGTGPFKVAEFAPPLSLKVQRFETYWASPSTLTDARYLSNHRAEARALMVESGDNDLAFTLDPAGFSRLARQKAIKAYAITIPRVIVAKLNLGLSPLADAGARRALSLAVDRQGIARGILRFPDLVATQLFPPIAADWHDPKLPPLERDVDEARRILGGLGWKPGPDGVLVRDGVRFSMTMRTFPNRPELPLIATALQDQWRQIGIELKVAVGSPADLPAGHNNGSLEMALYARNYSLTPDPLVSATEDYREGGGEWGAMNWKAPAVANALQKAAVTTDPEERLRAIRVVTDALQAELPVLPIAWYNLTAAYSASLEGVILDPFERTYGLSNMRWVR